MILNKGRMDGRGVQVHLYAERTSRRRVAKFLRGRWVLAFRALINAAA